MVSTRQPSRPRPPPCGKVPEPRAFASSACNSATCAWSQATPAWLSASTPVQLASVGRSGVRGAAVAAVAGAAASASRWAASASAGRRAARSLLSGRLPLGASCVGGCGRELQPLAGPAPRKAAFRTPQTSAPILLHLPRGPGASLSPCGASVPPAALVAAAAGSRRSCNQGSHRRSTSSSNNSSQQSI